MTLLGDRVQIEPIIETKKGSIHLVRMSMQMPDRGLIIAISKKAAEISGCKVGDKVIFFKQHQKLSDDQKTTTVAGCDLLATFTDEPEACEHGVSMYKRCKKCPESVRINCNLIEA